MAKEKLTKKIIIRACVGCILPIESVLIGKGDYTTAGDKTFYYDYEISLDDYDEFVITNQKVLIDNNLLKIEKSEEEIQKELEKLKKENEPVITPNGYVQRKYPRYGTYSR